jgi:hypothetical protein
MFAGSVTVTTEESKGWTMPRRDQFKSETEWLEHLHLWFAGMALQGLLNRGDELRTLVSCGEAYEFADAMLAEREKGKK